MNTGRWSNSQLVHDSLSKLMRIDGTLIDLKRFKRLSSHPYSLRLLLEFGSNTIPLTLPRMLWFLTNFHITARRVFIDPIVKPLILSRQDQSLALSSTQPTRPALPEPMPPGVMASSSVQPTLKMQFKSQQGMEHGNLTDPLFAELKDKTPLLILQQMLHVLKENSAVLRETFSRAQPGYPPGISLLIPLRPSRHHNYLHRQETETCY